MGPRGYRNIELRLAQAYLIMARAQYRPAAPSDGMGDIQLTKEECNDRERLYREAVQYVGHFAKEDDSRTFNVGCSNWETNRATVLSIEAPRLLAGGSDGNNHAVKLLRLAIKEITDASNRRKIRQNKPRLSPLSSVA